MSARISRLGWPAPRGTGSSTCSSTTGAQFPSHTIGTLAFGADGTLYAGAWRRGQLQLRRSRTEREPVRRPVPRGRGPALAGSAHRRRSPRAQRHDHPHRSHHRRGSRRQPARRLTRPERPPHRRRTGLRNPFRFTVRPGTNTLWLGDVGWRTWEEINRTAGTTASLDDFGWPCMEGPGAGRTTTSLDLPICEGLYGDGDVVAARVHLPARPDAGRRAVPDRARVRRSRAWASPRTTRPTPRRTAGAVLRRCHAGASG